MITVAKGIDIPIGIKTVGLDGRPKLLGLGDIIFPGLFIAMAYRFDCTMRFKNSSFVSS